MSNPILLYFLGLCIILLFFNSCSNRPRSNDEESSVKFEQYYIHGEVLYNNHCSNCHQKNGEGLKQIYPPLNISDFMKNNFEQTICLIKNGISGEIIVNGKKYNQSMMGMPQLTPLEIAEIATYIYNRKSHKKGMIETKTVEEILEKCR